jgi:hypothetical protein
MLGHTYMWVVGVSNEGKKTLIGPFEDKIEALNAEDDLHEAKTYSLKTRDRTKATRIIKEKFRESGHGVDSALQRVSHKPTERGLVDTISDKLQGRKKSPEESIFDGDPFE